MIDPMMHARLCRQAGLHAHVYTPSMTVFNIYIVFNISMQLPMHVRRSVYIAIDNCKLYNLIVVNPRSSTTAMYVYTILVFH